MKPALLTDCRRCGHLDESHTGDKKRCSTFQCDCASLVNLEFPPNPDYRDIAQRFIDAENDLNNLTSDDYRIIEKSLNEFIDARAEFEKAFSPEYIVHLLDTINARHDLHYPTHDR